MRSADLAVLLDAFEPADALEADFHRRMLDLCTADDPFSRKHFVPGHFTASSFVVPPSRDRLLLIHHTKLDRWLQPGGHIEADDADIESAARREAVEETGIAELELLRLGGSSVFDVDIHALPAIKDEPAHEHFDVRFLFVAPSEDAHAGDGVKDARWFPFDQVNSIESDESVMRALRKMRAHFGG